MSGILVIGEVQDGAVAPVTGELLAAAGKLADEGVSGGVSLAVMGDDLSAMTAADAPGADRVILVSHAALKDGGTGGVDAPVLALRQPHTPPSSWPRFRSGQGPSTTSPRIAPRWGANSDLEPRSGS